MFYSSVFYGKNAVNERQTQEFFARFSSKNFEAKDAPGPSCPEQELHASSQEIAEALRTTHATLWNHYKWAGYSKKLEKLAFLKSLIMGDEK